ncbi:MAG: hypothetical protein ABUK01_06335 [Leptospirales bacterium]
MTSTQLLNYKIEDVEPEAITLSNEKYWVRVSNINNGHFDTEVRKKIRAGAIIKYPPMGKSH